jgi:hypothetical protein
VVDLVLSRGEMARQQPKKYTQLEFLNITNPAQRQDGAHQKKVRKHAISHYWQARKDLSRIFSLPVDRQSREFQTSPGCVCHGLKYIENGGSRKPCLPCRGDLTLRLDAKGDARRWEANRNLGEKSMVTQASGAGGADRFPALELGNPRVLLGAGDRDPFSSFPIPTGQDSGLTEMLLRHCK